MISNTYGGINPAVADVVRSIIPANDNYHLGHARRMARTIEVILDQKPTGKLLELGTYNLVPLALRDLASDLEVHVTDFNLDLPQSGSTTLSMSHRSIEVPCYRVDLESTPIPVADGTFDYVLCSEVIEHMEIDPMFMLSEINRVLKFGGCLVMTTPNITSSRAIWKILRGFEPHFYMHYQRNREFYRHNYEYSLPTLRAVLRGAGFSVEIWTEDSFEDPVTDDIDKLRKLGYPLHNVGDNIFAVAHKSGPVKIRHPRAIYSD
jgi:ubiquinone/menaquinone biosynthesis C-methylase UbiE